MAVQTPTPLQKSPTLGLPYLAFFEGLAFYPDRNPPTQPTLQTKMPESLFLCAEMAGTLMNVSAKTGGMYI